MTDYNNWNIKSVLPNGKVVSVLSLPCQPLGITVLDATTAVTTADYRKLYIINITDHAGMLSKGESQLQYVIEVMTNYNGNMGAVILLGQWLHRRRKKMS